MLRLGIIRRFSISLVCIIPKGACVGVVHIRLDKVAAVPAVKDVVARKLSVIAVGVGLIADVLDVLHSRFGLFSSCLSSSG